MTWFMKPYVTELKAVKRQFRNCFRLFFPTATTGRSITYERKAIPCASSASLKRLNTDSNNSMLNASLSETIILVAN